MLKRLFTAAVFAPLLFTVACSDDDPKPAGSVWYADSVRYIATNVFATEGTKTVQANDAANNNIVLYLPYIPSGTDTFYLTSGAATGHRASVVIYQAAGAMSYTSATLDSTYMILSSSVNDRLHFNVQSLPAIGVDPSDTVMVKADITIP